MYEISPTRSSSITHVIFLDLSKHNFHLQCIDFVVQATSSSISGGLRAQYENLGASMICFHLSSRLPYDGVVCLNGRSAENFFDPRSYHA